MARAKQRQANGSNSSPTGRVGRQIAGTMGGVLEGMEDIVREVGSTAAAAVRGSMRAVERIGGDLARAVRNTLEGRRAPPPRSRGAPDPAPRRHGSREESGLTTNPP